MLFPILRYVSPKMRLKIKGFVPEQPNKNIRNVEVLIIVT